MTDDREILVIGAVGIIGFHVARQLLTRGTTSWDWKT